MMITVCDVKCPKCKAEEMHPDGKRILIRAFKIHSKGRWYSQCLVCSGFYNPDLTESTSGHNPKLGWFA